MTAWMRPGRAAEILSGFACKISLETDRMAAQRAVPVADRPAYGHREQRCRAGCAAERYAKKSVRGF